MKTIFTHPECDYSEMLLDELKMAGEKYHNINLLVDPEYWDEVENICNGGRMTPLIINPDGTHIVGYQGVASEFK